jgi:hypothetical protein
MGGLYFIMNALMSQVLLWGTIMFYIDRVENESDASKLTAEKLISMGQFISASWVVSVSVFFVHCKREYRGSFFDTGTASTYAKDCFDWQMNQGVADEAIVWLFSKHPSVYKNFEGELGMFVQDNWEKWNNEKPRFFTNKFIKSVPFSVLSKEMREEDDYNADEYEYANERVS